MKSAMAKALFITLVAFPAARPFGGRVVRLFSTVSSVVRISLIYTDPNLWVKVNLSQGRAR